MTSSTASSVLLHWKQGYNGGAPLTGYTLHYRTTHGNLDELQLSRRATSHELKVSSFRSMIIKFEFKNVTLVFQIYYYFRDFCVETRITFT